MSKKGAEKVAEVKVQEVAEIKKLISEYPVVGIANLENLPSPQLQKMRSQLQGKLVVKMSKKRLIKIAFDAIKKEGMDILKTKLKGMPALIFTKDDPFKLYKTLDKSKSGAPIKAGQKAPKDILVPAGPTGFAPGPIISELGAAGLKTAIEGGKIVIKEDKIVAKEDEVVNDKIAGVLAKLGIEPMEIGINLVCVYDQGIIYEKSILAVDEKEYLGKIQTAQNESLNLAVKLGWVVDETINTLLQKAEREAKAVLDKSDFLTSDKAKEKVAEAEGHMKSLKAKVKLPETSDKSQLKEEVKPEEKKEDSKDENPNPSTQELIDNAEGETKDEKEIREVEELTKEIIDKGAQDNK